MSQVSDVNGYNRVIDGDCDYVDVVDMGACEFYLVTHIYVDDSISESGDGTSWPDAFKTLQEALDSAVDGTNIHVADGIYSGDCNTNLAINGINVVFQSENGVDACTLDCADSARAFLSTSADVILVIVGIEFSSGFTGDGDGGVILCNNTDLTVRNCVFRNNYAGDDGGAIMVEAGALNIENCVFENNESYDDGGAVYILEGRGVSKIADSVFDNNFSGGSSGALRTYAAIGPMLVNDSRFCGNNAADDGGAVDVVYCYGLTRFTGCVFEYNTSYDDGNAIRLYGTSGCSSETKIINCAFANNGAGSVSSSAGGAIYAYSALPLSVINTVFDNNTSGNHGGALYLYNNMSASLVNVTFRNNRALQYGGAIYYSSMTGTLLVNNSLLYENYAPDGHEFYVFQASVTASNCFYDNSANYSYIQPPGELVLQNCISGDPLFINRSLRLRDDSPCRDMGCNAYINEYLDLDKNPRIFDNVVDIGAYETCVAESSIGVKLRLIPRGTYYKGDSYGGGESDERPVHMVNLTNSFYMGVYEVTQAQWFAVMGTFPSNFTGDNNPVEQITWDDAQAFVAALNTLENTSAYRLPTEAEWEYACRAGSANRFYFGDNEALLGDYAWFDNNSSTTTHQVGLKLPNSWGLYDMHGNVWEWCQDWYDADYYQYCVDNGIVNDPQGPATGTLRVLLGGGWADDHMDCRSSNRGGLSQTGSDMYYGLRICKDFGS